MEGIELIDHELTVYQEFQLIDERLQIAIE